MDYKERCKLSFATKYGSDSHKAKASAKVDKVFDGDDLKTIHNLVNSDHPLTSEQIHKVLDKKGTNGFNHPGIHLSGSHFGELKDEHWDRIAKHPDDQVTMQNLPHMPLKHLRTVVAAEHHDPFIRQMAANQYRNKKAAGYPE